MNNRPSSREFPWLFQVAAWGAVRCRFELRDCPPPASLISNVNIVPFVGDRCLLTCLRNGKSDIPGGTLEPGEAYEEAIRRELLEEAGARLLSFTLLGAWHCRSSDRKPYRPHLPHPEFYRVVGYGDVEMVAEHPKADGREEPVSVDCVPPEEAINRLWSIGRPELADLYRLAAVLREATGGR